MKIIFFIFLFSFSVIAQDDSSDFNVSNFNQEKIESIEIVKKNLVQTKALLTAKEAEALKEKDPKRKLILESEIKSISKRFDKLILSLIAAITNIKMDEIQNLASAKRDYLQEVQDLLGPAFDTIQRISERPRKIEALRKELQIYNQKLAITQAALDNIAVVETSKDFKALLPEIKEFLEDASYNVFDLNQEFQLKADRLNRELAVLTKDDKSLFQAFTDLFKQFISQRGKHLGVAFLIFILVAWTLTIIKNKIILQYIKKRTIAWVFKPISALYGLFTLVLALSLSVLSLYLMGDWVLFTLTILFLSALLWGSKNYLHKYLAQGRLILNLGTIKEGELVIFREIPWRVKTINFVTIFENDFLDSSIIRIEISQIFQMHSRAILPNEQWFPSRTNDWVQLSDGTFGQIKLQTVEQVVIELKNAERRYFTTQDYLNLRPTNLSHGYTLDLIWGLDFEDRDQLLSIIIPKFSLSLSEKLKLQTIPVERFSIDFHSAGASSLNLYLEVLISGDNAASKLDLQRVLNRLMFEISIEEKLNLPFNQLVVHGLKS